VGGGMSNIGIVVKSWGFLRFVHSNKLAARLSRDAWVELLAFLIPSHPAFGRVTSSGQAHNLQLGAQRSSDLSRTGLDRRVACNSAATLPD
jgi:hypothetical protein